MKLKSSSAKTNPSAPKESPESLLEQHPNVFKETDRGKLLCVLTKHELPPSELPHYVKSKKFLWEWKIHQIYEQYGDYFEDMGPAVLACRVTLRTVARDPADLERHVKGKRFQKELPIYLAKKEAEKQKEAELKEKETARMAEISNAKDAAMEVEKDEPMKEVDDALESSKSGSKKRKESSSDLAPPKKTKKAKKTE